MAANPINFSPTTDFIGNDGLWSSFAVSVGTPSQLFRVLPATGSQETWIPVPEACQSSNSSACASSRGAVSRLFRNNASDTWKEIGIYDLALGKELGYQGNGIYGMDTVRLEFSGSEEVKLDGQVVAGIATEDFYVGLFGLGPSPVNFTNMDYPVPSFLGTLVSQGEIPSSSYAYTAGASYRTPKVSASLTLGGYDESRFIPSDSPFPFGSGNTLNLFIQSITASDSLKGRATLLDDSQVAYTTIDSSIPHIWLPRDVCDRFEEAFGLRYDPETDLYLTDFTNRDQMLRKNASITIGLGATSDPANRTNIVLPYAAFDLQASAPIYQSEKSYFPIRRAANDTQYRLGRTFLQEAYIIADFERSTFSVHQARYQEVMPPESIIPILPENQTESNSELDSRSHAGMQRSQIIGIAVGACSAVLLFTALAVFLFRRWRTSRRRNRQKSDIHDSRQPHLTGKDSLKFELQAKGLNELHDSGVHEMSQLVTEVCERGRSVLLSDDLSFTLAELPTPVNRERQ